MNNKFVKSMQENIRNIQDIYITSGNVIKFQNNLEKLICREEAKDWTENELKTMRIRVKSIDMVFVAIRRRHCFNFQEVLLARQIINGIPIYFQLIATSGLDKSLHHGDIVYFKSPRVFLKNCSANDCVRERMYNFLKQPYKKKRKHQCSHCKNRIILVEKKKKKKKYYRFYVKKIFNK